MKNLSRDLGDVNAGLGDSYKPRTTNTPVTSGSTNSQSSKPEFSEKAGQVIDKLLRLMDQIIYYDMRGEQYEFYA